MIGTVETRKIVMIELERSEVINVLNGAHIKGTLQIRHDKSDVPMDCVIFCSTPISDDPKENGEGDEFWNPTGKL